MVHCYKLAGYNIVIDSCSGAVHSVDDAAYDMISHYKDTEKEQLIRSLHEKYRDIPEDELRECYGDITELEKTGKLFCEDKFEPIAGELKKRSAGIVKALCLHIAHSCNLNCSYCFASQGKYNGERAIMSYEIGCKALDFLIEHSGSRHNLEVDFFGGEPLMNFDVVKRLVKYAREREKKCGKHFRFTLTTNGMLIDDDVIDFANRECDNVVLSLDGRKEVHDRFRVDYNGRGSWEKIVPKFQKLVAARGGKSYYMRGTFTHYNPDFLNDVKEMLRLGFRELSMEPVVCPDDDPSALTDEDAKIVMRQYEQLAELMLEKYREGDPFTFYHYMLDLKDGPCVYKRISGCGSGTEYMAVTPTGELYPCHQFVGDKKFLLGTLDTGVTNDAIQQCFSDSNVYTKPECADCWAKLYCSGGCAANAYHATGSVNGVYKRGCDLFKKRMECAVMLEVAKSAESD